MERRRFLQLMMATPVIVSIPLQPLLAAPADASQALLLRASELLTGRRGLDIGITERLWTLLCEQDSQFPAQLARLMTRLNALHSEDREQIVAQLDDADVKTALTIISPWYLGYTGHPSTTKAVDDAHFVTFLSALMYEPTRDHTIRPSYARAGGDYWAEVPPGVIAPPMSTLIREWGDQSPLAAKQIKQPDAPWLLMVQGKAKTLVEAEAMLAQHNNL
ncbi:sorbitol dehydrogenase family protein [Erwinia sp. S63]|uniref:sorbitol dehydrogenase family protein n=1 Tax=Erwinia sp. S63 TaxID=2769341 RepID=UPI0019096804|nr:sorbitol dehydrogenase family protein [Erwinia sp. S63]MBK0096037.1 sorbitol dehydrogenase family protein [Erwinia sp. S63]